MTRARVGFVVGAALAMLSVAAPASADPASARRADKLFKEASEALAQKHYAEACPKLEESDRLERAVGTEYNLAVCYELSHRPAAARRMYGKVAIFASQSGKEAAAKDARASAKKLDAIVPRLVLKAPSDPTVKVRCDDQEIDVDALQRPIELDPGSHRVVATRAGAPAFEKIVSLDEGETKEVTIVLAAGAPPAIPVAPPKQDPSSPAADEAPTGGVPWRWVGVGVAAVGLVGAGVGGYFGLRASGERDDSGCRDGQFCPDDASAERLRSAKSDANLATIFMVGGGALVATGVVIFVVAPSPARGGVAVGPTPMGMRVAGTF
ncbi:MAG TPA: hypothetical protein VLT33_31850 [Labilithrix sp.]|nr:hypothetical protein [Labilithrix sp.]